MSAEFKEWLPALICTFCAGGTFSFALMGFLTWLSDRRDQKSSPQTLRAGDATSEGGEDR